MMINSLPYSLEHGKESDIRDTVKYLERVNRDWVERTYQGILTRGELSDVLDHGKDLYLFAEDLRERMPLHKEYRAACKSREMEEMLQYWKSQQAA
ncbi:hypothetical protein D3C76_1490720 [compost metagenome]